MTHDDPIRALLDGLQRPAPPPELEGRTLAAAGLALRQPPEPDFWERVWSSHPLRLAWATSVVALIGGHLVVSVYQRANHEPGLSPVAMREDLGPEIARIADLPAISFSTIAWEPGAKGAPTNSMRTVTNQEIRQ